MFYLKKVAALLEEEKARAKLESLGARLKDQGIWFQLKTVEKPRAGEIVWESAGQCPGGVLWITDSPEISKAFVKQERPLLVYLHPWNRDASFPLAGFAMEEPQELEVQYLENVYRRFADIPWEILTTERCRVREMTLGDLPALEEIYKDREVRRFTGTLYGEETGGNRQLQESIMENYIRQVYGFYGYGVWIIEEKQSGAVIGRAGYRPVKGDAPELGYVIGAPWRRKGFAREVCSAVLDYGRENLSFRRVQALVQEENVASIGLCRKLGFEEAGKVAEEGRKCIRFLYSFPELY